MDSTSIWTVFPYNADILGIISAWDDASTRLHQIIIQQGFVFSVALVLETICLVSLIGRGKPFLVSEVFSIRSTDGAQLDGESRFRLKTLFSLRFPV